MNKYTATLLAKHLPWSDMERTQLLRLRKPADELNEGPAKVTITFNQHPHLPQFFVKTLT